MNKAISDVAAERLRQVQDERYDSVHDDSYDGGELAAAGGCYAFNAACLLSPANGTPMELETVAMFGWPWPPEAWKPKNPRRDLVRAAALIIAEIERLDRSTDDGKAS